MTQTVTVKDLEGAFKRYTAALEVLEMIPTDRELILTHGSKTNGIAFRLATVSKVRGEGRGHFGPPAGSDFLGMTKSEAYYVLADRASVLEDVAYAQKVNA